MNTITKKMIIATGIIDGKKLQVKFGRQYMDMNGLSHNPVVTFEGIGEGTFHVIDDMIVPSDANEDEVFDTVCDKLGEMIQDKGFGSEDKVRGFVRWTYTLLGHFSMYGVDDGRVYCMECDDVLVEYDEHTHYSGMTS